MYALIDTFNGYHYDDGQVLGGIISRHRTVAAAEKANARHQRAVKRANGRTSYIPTAIVEVEWTDGKRARGPAADRSYAD